jgi:vancomycin resistance protein YoaR
MTRTRRPAREPAEQDGRRGACLAWVLGAMALLLLALGGMLAYPLAWQDRVLPGISVAGVDLGGLDEAQAAQKLRDELPGAAPLIELRDLEDDRRFEVVPEAIGLPWDAGRLAAMAMEAGRGPWPWQPLLTRLQGIDLAASLRLDEGLAAAGLAALAPEMDIAPRDASAELVDGRLETTASRPGKQLDPAASLERLREAVTHPDELPINVVTRRTSPRIFSDEGVGDAYRLATGSPLELRFPDGRSWIVSTDTLRSWFSVEQRTNDEGDRQPFVLVDRGAVERWVAPLEQELVQEARNARFTWRADGVVVRDLEQPGLRLDVQQTVDRLIEAAYWEGRVVDAFVGIDRPAITRNAVAGLQGLRELGRAATSLAGLPAEHVTVLAAAVERLDGIVVPGRDSYSLRAGLGSVAEDPAFEAVRVASQALPEEAGMLAGMDQIATTAFRAALWAGLPIVERHAPAQRSGWLEPPIGLDAVVDMAGDAPRDLVVRNDRRGPLLMAVELDASRAALVWTVYGQPNLRRVRLTGPQVGGLTPPASPVERNTTSLPPGVRRQVAWAREGAVAQVGRAVFSPQGDLLFEDSFESVYSAVGDTILRGVAP